jgi:aryl-alcohol dehydrogenase-like predicted oxidoreductase
MEYRRLGRTDLKVSLICLGTMTWGQQNDEADGHAQMDYALDQGVNFFDTAELYSIPPRAETQGSTERIIGSWFKSRGSRDKVILATKVVGRSENTWFRDDGSPAELSRRQIEEAVDKSLKRLQTDYIDLYWVHIWDQITPVEEVMRALDDLVRQGKVLYVGISDAPAWWIAQANTLATLRGWSPFVGLQIEYSLIERTVERELIPMAKALDLGVTAWSPLSSGVLTGKYHGHGSSERGRMSSDMVKEFMPEEQRAKRIVAAVKSVADEIDRSMAQVALAWLRYRPLPVIPIIGARKLSQLKDNLASSDVSLSAKQLKTLDEASRIDLGFPHEFYTRDLVRGLVYGGMRDRIVA